MANLQGNHRLSFAKPTYSLLPTFRLHPRLHFIAFPLEPMVHCASFLKGFIYSFIMWLFLFIPLLSTSSFLEKKAVNGTPTIRQRCCMSVGQVQDLQSFISKRLARCTTEFSYAYLRKVPGQHVT